MILIYWKWKVWLAIASLCDWQGIKYHICDDANRPDSYDVYEYIIPSPGIPWTHEVYQTGKIISELDFAYQFLPKKFQIISVTWTDWKSTTSWIMYNILEKEFSVNKSVYLSGNFDVPFSATILDILKKWEKKWIIVVEVSSFMAFSLKQYQSDYSIFTNFKPDHLNWHKDLQEYLDAKMNLMLRTKKKAIINEQIFEFAQDENLIIEHSDKFKSFWMNTTSRDSTDGENIKISGRRKYTLSEWNFSWKHNALNILSCLLVANGMKICSKRSREYLNQIKWLPHRLEIIANKWWIVIVEDSKSTSSQSLAAALGSFGDAKNLLLIVGGSDKGDSFSHLHTLFSNRVAAMVCIGTTKQQFIDIAKTAKIEYLSTDNLVEWVTWLYDKKKVWDVLMLSPGCASFWLFKDYLDRANQFRDIIKKLPE